MTTLNVTKDGGEFVFNPRTNPNPKMTIRLGQHDAGRAAMGLLHVQEGRVLDVPTGVVRSLTSESKVYVYTPSLEMFVEAQMIVDGNGDWVCRRSKSLYGDLVPSKGYFYTRRDGTRAEVPYDSHHLAWLYARGYEVRVPDTEVSEARIRKYSAYAETDNNQRSFFCWHEE